MRARLLAPLASLLALPLAAQQEPGGVNLPVTLRGEMGTSAELYSVDGRDPRRPSSTAEFFVRSTVTLFGEVSTDIDLLISSEEVAGLGATPGVQRQRLNRLGIRPSWSWGRAYIGSFSETYSRYTFRGVRMVGGGFALNPGLLRVGSVYGVTEQPLRGGATDGSYRRRLAGGRLGIGRGNGRGGGTGTFVDLIFLRAWDDEGSLSGDGEQLDPLAGVPVNTFAVTPQENVVGGLTGRVEVIPGRLSLAGEATAALHSRDSRARELDEETLPSYPGFLRGLLTPRVSTHADYAYRLEATARIPRLPGSTPRAPRVLELAGEYSYIGPGYVSLGVASLPADQRAVALRGRLRFPRWSVGLQTRRQSDNLVGQKLATTARNQVGANVSLQATRRWRVSLRGSFLQMGNDASDSLRRVDYTSRMISVSNNYSLGRGSLFRSVGLSYGYRAAGDDNPLRTDGQLRSHNVDLRVGIAPLRALNVTPSIGVVRSRSGETPWSTRESYAISATARLLDRRLTTTVSAGTSRAAANRSTRASIGARFRVNDVQSISLRVSTNRYRSPAVGDAEFTEYVAQLQVVRELR